MQAMARCPEVQVSVLGPLEVVIDGRPVAPPASRRAWALLGYLALHPGPIPRGQVAAALWPRVHEQSARGSLRSATWALRRAFGRRAAEVLLATRESVGLTDDGRLVTDLREFGAALSARRHELALGLCRGPLLFGIDDDWALIERAAFAERVGEALGALTTAALARGDTAAAVAWARRRARAAPLDEHAARSLMVALEATGEYAEALRVERALADRLRRELFVAPAAATRTLGRRIRLAAVTREAAAYALGEAHATDSPAARPGTAMAAPRARG
jgi:DNA-binding SARP family transcriptional activator